MSSALGNLLLQAGVLDQQQLQEQIEIARRRNVSLWELIIEEKHVSEDSLAEAFSTWLKLARIRLASTQVEPEAVALLPEELARKHLCLPIRIDGKTLVVALANPSNYEALQDIQFASGKTVKAVVASRAEILDAIEEYYSPEQAADDFLANVAEAGDFRILSRDEESGVEVVDGRNAAHLPPVVKICNLLIHDAIRAGASDIHVEAALNSVQVRYRVDGVLRDYMQIPKWLQTAVVSRLKILAKLDIAERRLPQDGRIKVQSQDRAIDIRLSTLPTHFGEKVVMRLLGSAERPPLTKLGYSETHMQWLNHALSQPQGLILVTGPTGSGKSTSLYAMLEQRRSPEVNIITVEDPIEYQLEGINQVQINTKAGLTFAGCLRSILRQDPDVILVGEIRDLETAEIAFHAAMTGHLVLTTLHTNSALGSISRLLELGVDPFTITGSLTLVTAQRLARKICRQCKEEYVPAGETLEKLRITEKDATFYRGMGCSACGKTGYAGRIGIYETLHVSTALKELIHRKAPETEMRRAAGSAGIKLLLDDAMDKVCLGLTTVDEILRVVQLEKDEVRHCPKCDSFIGSDFSTCPYCLYALKYLCHHCGQELKLEWRICPYCNKKVAESLTEGTGLHNAALPAPNGSTFHSSPSSDVRSGRRKTDTVTPSQAPAVKNPRILVVDDDEGIRKIIAKGLEQLPMPAEVFTAADGVEALQRIQADPVDLVILDVMMPRMDGFGVCERLRADVRTAFIPVLMLTASADESHRSRGYMIGTDDYMSKPFAVQELNLRILRLLRRTYGL